MGWRAMGTDEEEELGLLAEFAPDVGPTSADDDLEMRNRGRARREKSPNARSVSLQEAEEEKGTAGLHIFWHRAGWLVLLLLCQSSSSFILQRPLGHEDRCQMQDTNLYNTVKCVFHALCLHFSHSSKDSRALD
ncbi:unnamed protein product [Cladocopium goreaui]|uniref:Uncharacterized protein n=1 Tax=Cladocopium goreaui TaxID=2562237 RepID=A0A9P1BIX5_9DINO|nr:unnamed protein product [Cladocopium goreaui]